MQFGGEIYKQFKGIAMGANSSTYVANMFLGAYELQFWEQLAEAVTEHPPTKVNGEILLLDKLPDSLVNADGTPKWTRGDVAIYIAMCYEHHKRYLDDIHSMNNPIFKHLIKEDQTLFGFHGIYPEELDIDETPPSARTPFLDVMIQCSTRLPYNLETIHYSKFDEKEYTKLHRPLYPAHHTNIAMKMKLGVIKGRLASFSRHITERHDFMRQAAKLAKIYMGKQYSFRKVKSITSTWMAKQNGLLFATSPQFMIELFERELASQLRSMRR